MNHPVKQQRTRILLFILAGSILLASLHASQGLTLEITLNSKKPIYGIGERAEFWGEVKGNSVPIHNALVAIEIRDPTGNSVILRSKITGTAPAASEIEIVNVSSCDVYGTCKNSFRRETLCYLKITVNNFSPAPKYAEMTVNILDSRAVVFEALVVFKGLLYPNTTQILVSTPIPLDVTLGTASAYVNIFTSLPSKGGFAYCPEKEAYFSISDTPVEPIPNPDPQSDGMYNLSFLVDNYFRTRRFKPGTYNATVTCKYQVDTAVESMIFEIVLKGDINRDGTVDIFDAILLSSAFNSVPSSPNWDPRADLDFSNVVDIFDAIILANNYGKTA